MTNRVFLAAYPARLRRRYGAELISTLSEMAEGRPSRFDRLRLVADGLRERFRLPARRPLGVVTAVVAMVIGGALGLAAGSWAGEQTYPSIPAAAPLASQVLGQPVQSGRYEAAGPTGVEQKVGEVHRRLAATGWEVTAIERHRGLDQWGFWAQSGGLRVSVWGYTDSGNIVEVMGYPVRPATYLPLVIGGLLLGLLAGWLVGAAMAHQLTTSSHRALAVVVAALGAVTLAVPAAKLYQNLIKFLRTDDGSGTGALVHDALAWMPWPLRDPTEFPDTLVPGLRTVLAGLALAGLAALIARNPSPRAAEPATPGRPSAP